MMVLFGTGFQSWCFHLRRPFSELHSQPATMGTFSREIQKARQMAKRNRSAIACARCRAMKSKCSDYRPCKHCASVQVPCKEFLKAKSAISPKSFSRDTQTELENYDLYLDENALHSFGVTNRPPFSSDQLSDFNNLREHSDPKQRSDSGFSNTFRSSVSSLRAPIHQLIASQQPHDGFDLMQQFPQRIWPQPTEINLCQDSLELQNGSIDKCSEAPGEFSRNIVSAPMPFPTFFPPLQCTTFLPPSVNTILRLGSPSLFLPPMSLHPPLRPTLPALQLPALPPAAALGLTHALAAGLAPP